MRKRIPERGLPLAPMPSLFGFAPGGVYHAASVTSRAVRSYRTLSPLLYRRPNPRRLPASSSAKRDRPTIKRFAFCGTFPGVAPAGNYPAPCFRGARTFLHSKSASTANGHSALLKQRPSGQLAIHLMAFRFIPSRASAKCGAVMRGHDNSVCRERYGCTCT